MKQSSFRHLGVFEILLVVFVVVFGSVPIIGGVAVLVDIAGVCAVLAGSVTRLTLGPVTIPWRYLVCLSYVAIALGWPLTFVPMIVDGTASQQDVLLLVVAIVSAASLAFFGIDIARGGRHFSITQTSERAPGK